MARREARITWLGSLSIKARLAGVLGLLGSMLVAGAVLGLGVMSWQKEGMRMSYEQALVPTELMTSFRNLSNMNYVALREAADDVTDEALVQRELARHEAIEAKVNALFGELAKATMFPDVAAAWKAYIDGNSAYVDLLGKVVEHVKARDPTVRDLVRNELQPKMLASAELVGRLVDQQSVTAKQLYEGQIRRYEQVRMLTMLALVLGLVIALAAGWLLIRSVDGGLKRTMKIAHSIATGHLDHDIHVDRGDEIGKLLEAFREMDERLSGTVHKVRAGTLVVTNAAGEIAKGNDDLSQRTQEQASSLEETAASMEEMTSTVKQNAENASMANQLAAHARDEAERGGKVAAEAATAMGAITASSKKIGDIVGMIDEIAFQTNLLSLNAAVEAARAGEQGRGFAVVAGEVRTLSQRSAEAAKEIKQLINESVARVETGSRLVEQSGESLRAIVESVRKVTDIVAEIAAASAEQSTGIDQVNRAVMQMDEVTQQNAALVEQAAAAARSMQDEAESLKHEVAFFRLDGRDAVPETTVVVPPAPRPVTAMLPARKPSPTSPAPAKSRDTGEWTEF